MSHQLKRLNLLLPFLFVLLAILCGLYVGVSQTLRPLYDLSRDITIPLSINANRSADYSPDPFAPLGNVSLNLILDLLQDLDPATAPESRMATLVGSLQTPVPSVTPPPGSTQPGPTAPATPVAGTPAVETPVTASPAATLPTTPVSFPTTAAPTFPSPPRKPTKTEIVHPPTIPPATRTATPTASFTATSTPTPEPLHLAFLNPSDGAVITDNAQTAFEAEAWDPAVGIHNGDGVTSITFTIYNSAGGPIHTFTDTAALYCAFGGDSGCKDAAWKGVVLASDTYLLEATLLTDAGEGKTITHTFTVPTQTHLDITTPATDGFIVPNMAETKFEAVAWDTAVGITNGAGIASITFTIFDSTGVVIHTYNDTTPLYCAFGGDVTCNTTVVAGVRLDSGAYSLEAIALTDAGDTKTATRTFLVP